MLDKLQIASVIGLVLLIFATASSQTLPDLEKKYGAPDGKGRYTVRKGVLVSITADQGQIRELKIEPDDSISEQIGVREFMAVGTTKAIIDELAPIVNRGKHIRSIVFRAGCVSVAATQYEQVTISFNSNECRESDGIISAGVRWNR